MANPYADLSDEYVRRLRAAKDAAVAFVTETMWLIDNGAGYRIENCLLDAHGYAYEAAGSLADALSEFENPSADTLSDHAEALEMDAGDARYHAMRDERV